MHGNYHAFTEQLAATLTADQRALGLVALGSMAERGGRKPDQFSDHDFFVIAEDAGALRGTTAWLPSPERIALWFSHEGVESAMRLDPAGAAQALLDLYEHECSGNARAAGAVRGAT